MRLKIKVSKESPKDSDGLSGKTTVREKLFRCLRREPVSLTVVVPGRSADIQKGEKKP